MDILVTKVSLAGLIAIQAVRRRTEGAVGLGPAQYIHRLLLERSRSRRNKRDGRWVPLCSFSFRDFRIASYSGLTAIQLVRRRKEGAVGSEPPQGIHRFLPGRASDRRYTRYDR